VELETKNPAAQGEKEKIFKGNQTLIAKSQQVLKGRNHGQSRQKLAAESGEKQMD